uniref:Tissue factor pathway inhibitor n=1 Tax=Buteo japonicus TaxID=224669 RepID=A0A8C0B780_9AVES
PHPVHHLPLFIEKPNFCFHEKDPGICRGYFSRYFYNKETKSCEVFKYGGCLGNQNNFKDLEECQITCQGNCKLLSSLFLALFLYKQCCVLKISCMEKKIRECNSDSGTCIAFFVTVFKPPPVPSLCMTPMDRGLCRAKELRFFYNYSTGRCHPFSYSGCGGNENNFTSRKSCLRICKKGMGRFNKKKGERRLIKINKKRKKQSVKALGEEIIPERIQL